MKNLIFFLFFFTFFISSYISSSQGQNVSIEKIYSYEEAFNKGKEIYKFDGRVIFGGGEIVTGFTRPYLDFKKHKKYFETAVKLAKNDKERISALIEAGKMDLNHIYQTDFSEAEEMFKSVLSINSATSLDKAQAHLGIGEIFLRKKDYISARTHFEEAKASGMEDRANLGITFSYLQERKYHVALTKLKELLSNPKLKEPNTENRQIEEIALGYISAIEQLPVLNLNRTRLFFNSETWSLVKKRALSEEKEYFAKIKKEVEEIQTWQIEKNDYGILLMKAAFVYKVTGNSALLEKITLMLRSTINYYLSRQLDWTRSYSRVGTISALDWVWEDLSPAERREFASGMLDYTYSVYLEDKIQNRLGRHNWYYIQDMLWYAGIVLLDDSLDDVEYARVLSVLGAGHRHEQVMFGRMLELAGDDGGWQPKLDYAFGHQPTVYWAFMHCWRSATGKEIEPNWVHIVNPDYILRNFLEVEGRAIRHFGYARSWGTKTTGPDLLYDHIRQFLHFFGSSEPGYSAIANLLSKRIEELGPSEGAHPINPFLYTEIDKAPMPGIPKGMPIARHYSKIGLVLMSSGFSPKDTYALFAAGEGLTSSEHFDATHFSIYKQGDLALDSGSGNIGQHTEKYAKQTVAHNAVLIHIPGETNYGGQNRTTSFAKVLAFETTPYFSYIATDATKTYHPDKCEQMVRQFIYLNPNLFLVFDRVVSVKPEYKKSWLLHTSNEPEIIQNELKVDQGDGRIFCRTLYPINAIIEKIGGPGKEFWTGDKNWPIGNQYFKRERMNSMHDVTDTIGRWRVEITPVANKNETSFLHLVQVSEKNIEKMVDSKVSEKDGKIRVSFSLENLYYSITVNNIGEIGGHIRITEDKTIKVDQLFTNEVMEQEGLACLP
ncbi:heparinase II/III family protein [bacterium]|nr:heparinase II/III family protein [bacterium]